MLLWCELSEAKVVNRRRLPQLLADADLKRFFRAIQDCGDVQHEILLKLLFYTAVRVSELVHIEVGDVDLDACKIFINRGKGRKCYQQHFCPYVLVEFMLRRQQDANRKELWLLLVAT